MTRSPRRRRYAFLCIGAVSLGVGCATLMYGTQQSIYIDSIPPGAHVTVFPTGQTLTTPGRVELAKNRGYTVRFELEGYETQSLNILQREVDAVAYGGLMGASVDRASGGAYELVPPLLRVELKPVGALSRTGTPLPSAVVATPSVGPVPVTFYNTNSASFTNPISIWIDDRQVGQLKRYQCLTVHVEPGAYRVTVAHTDVVTFDDDYRLEVPRAPVFIEVYSEFTSTGFRLHDSAPFGFSALFKERPAFVVQPIEPTSH